MTKLIISAKCSDAFYAAIENTHRGLIGEYDGYVPKFMGPEGYGDYVELEIDVETGHILNWNAEEAKKFIEENS